MPSQSPESTPRATLFIWYIEAEARSLALQFMLNIFS